MSTYTGQLLRINLSDGTIKVETIPEQIRKVFLGGRGLGINYLYHELTPGIDPLGAENKLFLLTGPLGGTSGQGFSKWVAMTKSPLTGCVARSIGGGDFGAYVKFAGFDFIIIEGKAQKPTYIYIEKGKAEILDAGDLWGLDTQQTQGRLKERHGQWVKVACIGPAGERLVRYAAIVSDRRTASRCGVGIVMGSKKLKAVAVNASGRPLPYDAEAFKNLVKKQIDLNKSNIKGQKTTKFGTGWALERFYAKGFYPVHNFQEGRLEDIEKLGPEEYAKVKVGNYGCYSCMIRCGQFHRVNEGKYKGAFSEGPEYETIYAFGGEVGNTDIGATIAADSLCDLLGIDTISCGNSIGFACELFQRGIITTKDTDGLDLSWGNHAAVLSLVEKIGQREGFGWILGEGVMRAAEHIGKGAQHYAMHVKGLELPGYEPRAIKGFGLNYATSNIGASHMYGYHWQEVTDQSHPEAVDPLTEEDKPKAIATVQKDAAVNDSIVVCNFGNPGLTSELRGQLLVAATGFDEFGDISYLAKAGERIMCLERAFNVREGFSRKDDILPARMLTEPLNNAGPATGQIVRNLDALLDEYYDALGYTREGIPSVSKLKELGLGEE